MQQFPEHKHTKSMLPLLAVMALLVFCFVPASAQISAGYDLFQTGSGASVDLSSIGLGNVPLQSFPIQSSLGNTDTIMHRTQNIPATGGSSSVVVTALFMKSVNSVTYNGQPVDVYVTLNNSGGAIPTTTLPQPDATSSSGSVTEKWGERRRKRMLRNSRLLLPASEVMAEVISFCQSIRVVIMNGPVCSNVQWQLSNEVLRLLRANQRELWTSSVNEGARSRSAWKVIRSC